MVGNDVKEDMIAQTVGLNVFLLTDNLINKDDEDISLYPHGSFFDLLDYISESSDGNGLSEEARIKYYGI